MNGSQGETNDSFFCSSIATELCTGINKVSSVASITRSRIKRINRFYLPGKVAFVDQRSLPAGGKTSGEMPLDERAGSPRAAQRLSLLARSREKKPHSRTSRGARLFALRSVRPSVRPSVSVRILSRCARARERVDVIGHLRSSRE